MENRIIYLFRPLLLSLFNVPNRHIHRYSCHFNQSSVLVSWVGAWARIWNLIFLYSWFSFDVIDHRAFVEVFEYSTCDASGGVAYILCSTTRCCACNKICNIFGFVVKELLGVG